MRYVMPEFIGLLGLSVFCVVLLQGLKDYREGRETFGGLMALVVVDVTWLALTLSPFVMALVK